jgi:hypothetical protein
MEQFLTGINIHAVLEVPLKKMGAPQIKNEAKRSYEHIFTNGPLPRYSLAFLGFTDEACSTRDGISSFHDV